MGVGMRGMATMVLTVLCLALHLRLLAKDLSRPLTLDHAMWTAMTNSMTAGRTRVTKADMSRVARMYGRSITGSRMRRKTKMKMRWIVAS